MNYIKDSFFRLKSFCEKEKFSGWDPYDALNSPLFKIPFLKNLKVFKLFLIQGFKNSPINFRKLFLVNKDYNPKGLALFLSGYINLYNLTKDREILNTIDFLKDKLLSLRSRGYHGDCWGYNFDWQSRAFFIPKFTPNVIVSTFAGHAFMDLYELNREKKYLDAAVSVSDFILRDLNRSYEDDNFCFSYSASDKSRIFNASLLASRYLARVSSYTANTALCGEAKKSVEFCIRHQNTDGSWVYGLEKSQGWCDSFHTGYNLESLYDYQKYTSDKNYSVNFDKGLSYYLKSFFTDSGIPKYYNNAIYPIDGHSCAELIVLLAKTGRIGEQAELVNRVLGYMINNMQNKDTGHFYYQIKKGYKITTPYMRWACAWMFYALTHYFYHNKGAYAQ